MKKYVSRVIGVYETRGAAETARERLHRSGLTPAQLAILEPRTDGVRPLRARSEDVLREILRDGVLGTIIGAVAGAIATLALVLAKQGLFDTDPWLGTLVMVGWGASVGALVGAAVGAVNRKAELADLLTMSLATGHVVVIVHAHNDDQAAVARTILGDTTNKGGGRTTLQ